MDKIAFHQESWKAVGFKKVIVSEWRKGKYRLNEWPLSYKKSSYPMLNSILNELVKLFYKWLSIFVNLFKIQFPSAHTFNTNFFVHTPFQDLPNSITRKRQVDKIKFVVSQTFFPYVHRPRGLWTWHPHFLLGGVTQVPGSMYMCCQALKDTELSAWGRN